MIYGQPVTFGGASGEISITDNGTFDVKKYATANVNVAPVLLWTNASPTSAFAEQTLSFNGNFDAYIVEARRHTDTARYAITFINETYKNVVVTGVDYSNNSFAYRPVTAYTANSITFGKGASNFGVNMNQDNRHIIPTRIWGVKFTL